MSRDYSTDYRAADPGTPFSPTTGVCVHTAVRIVRYYGERIPSRDQLMRDFGMSKATAHRWRNAFLAAMGRAA